MIIKLEVNAKFNSVLESKVINSSNIVKKHIKV